MPFFLYSFFHRKTNERVEEGKIPIPENISEWPESWKKTEYKEYHVFPPIMLPSTEGKLLDISRKRQATGKALSRNTITLDALSYMLECGYGLQRDPEVPQRAEFRNVPSAGQRYPLELYVFLFRDIEGCQAGAYHYGIRDHTFEPVMRTLFSLEDIESLTQQKAIKGANGMICITGVFHRTVEKYGSRGYRYILLEAGHVAQNILLAGTERGIAIIPIGGSSEKIIEWSLGLNARYEGVVYTLFF
jgi:SagB-type dehydrogenase family enzyme